MELGFTCITSIGGFGGANDADYSLEDISIVCDIIATEIILTSD